MMKENCWEFKRCGRGIGGQKVKKLGVCPAASNKTSDGINGGTNAGRICWLIAGTFCKEKKKGTFAQDKRSCMTCDFFLKVKDEEGNSFKMAL
ncbi:MAG: hypothetical protein KKH94_08315 [Candidatus Omnitrophica bacterium]|nr:hypothetical protein [Candidatus Omnitrophota bacterium]